MIGWIVGNVVCLSIGVGIGWVLFKRPQWVEKAIAWLKRKIGLGG